MHKIAALGTTAAGAPLGPLAIDRREPRADDVVIDVLFCGICHSDIHQARDEWGGARFPMVPGHEIVGRVRAVGGEVTRFRVGDMVGVGCMVDSCRVCAPCQADTEQFCVSGCAFTYNGTEMDRVTPTHGGYAKEIVVTERFVVRIPDGLDPAAAAPLLCAGVTTWSPLRRFDVKAGDRVAVVGLGGLGHVAVKLAAAMGAEVTVLSTSEKKREDAKRVGAHEFSVSTDEALAKLAGRFDLLLDTVSAQHDYGAYLSTVKLFGNMVIVGVPPEPVPLRAGSLIFGNKSITGSLIGGIAETQAMLDACGKSGVVADVEVIDPSYVNEAYDRTVKSDVRYRFVIDTSKLG